MKTTNHGMSEIRSVCIYCGSSPGRDPIYVEEGAALGRALAEAGIGLVYGGGTKGVMGAVSEATKAAGGHVTGIIPRFLMRKEATEEDLQRLDELLITDDMHQRKHAMFERSDAFVALPGGIGTVEEIVEVMTWAQLGRHRKPMVFVNVSGFWDPMRVLIDHMSAEGFVHTAHLVRPLFVDRATDVLPAIRGLATEGTAEGDQRVIDRL